jgi:hypothetical protein
MKVIHFTEGAAEHFESSQVTLTKFIPLLQGTADTYVTCLHFLPGASLVELPTAQECALLIVSGSVTILNLEPRFSVDLYPGVGVVVEEGDGYARTRSLCLSASWDKHGSGKNQPFPSTFAFRPRSGVRSCGRARKRSRFCSPA